MTRLMRFTCFTPVQTQVRSNFLWETNGVCLTLDNVTKVSLAATI